jgi:predicted AlkP superfamily phosphohydrolase/phosphomutase
MRRLLIIGLDGATFDLIRPWAEDGKLPNLKGLLDQSSYGPLASTVPPMTFPSWNTFMTGMNPGKHGIYDFTERKRGTFEIQLINSLHRRCKTIWKTLSDAGKRVGVVGVPVCYPPEPINGVMISGFDAPVAVANEKVMYPPELYREIKDAIGSYVISADIVPLVSKGKIEEAIVALEEVIEKKAAAAQYLLKRERWDCFMIVFGETDACVHYFWRYHDSRSPHHDPKRCVGFRNPILAVYQKVDQMIGELSALVDEETDIMLVSDHGTGGSSDHVIHLNRWLEQQGFLSHLATSKPGLGARLSTLVYGKFFHWGKSWARTLLPKWIINPIRFGNKRLAYKLESKLRFSSIDWSSTKAFSEETPYYPQIWINLKGRDPMGIVEPTAYEEVRQAIIDELFRWKNPESGESMISRIYRREEVFKGPYLDKAPDLLIEWNLDGGYAYLFRPSSASTRNLPVEKVKQEELWNSRFMINRSGSHRDEGIFAIKGKGIRENFQIKDAQIGDLASTILYLMELPVDPQMDGKVLTGVFYTDHLKGHPIRYAKSSKETEDVRATDAYSDEDMTKVSQRLQDLGYLD